MLPSVIQLRLHPDQSEGRAKILLLDVSFDILFNDNFDLHVYFILIQPTFVAENDNLLTSVCANQPITSPSIVSDGTSSSAIKKVSRPRGRPPKRSVAPFVNKGTDFVDVHTLPNVTTDQSTFQTPPSVLLNIGSCKFSFIYIDCHHFILFFYVVLIQTDNTLFN